MDVPQSIHSLTEGHLGCFQVLAIMNKAAINIMCLFLCRYKFSTHLGKYQGAQSLDPMVRVCLVLYLLLFLPEVYIYL